MERQKSFSFKSPRTLAFVLTLSSCLFFLASISVWFLNSNPTVYQDTSHLQLHGPSIDVRSVTGLRTNFSASKAKHSILVSTHLNATRNSSGFSSFLGNELNDGRKVKTLVWGDGERRQGLNGNFSSVEDRPEAEPAVLEKGGDEEGEKVKREVKELSFEVIEGLRAKKLKEKEIEEKSNGNDHCDVTKGRWVYDDGYPLYTNSSCPFIDEGFDCQSNGRLDKDYMKWRWQPDGCNIPRFNATKMLESIRGKRLVFVGDSINRNQWESLLCMLTRAVKDPKNVYEARGRRITKEKGNYSFRFVDYKCTVEYYVTHFLVHESKARIGQKRKPTLRIDAIDRGSSRWRAANILIFNSAHWWSHYKTKAGINYYQEGNFVHPQLDVSTAFRRAITTWAIWVDKHIDAKKTRVFFRSSAPSHFRGGQWNSGGHCNEATKPLNKTSIINHSEKNLIVEEVIKVMRTPVTFLNITGLSEYRIDAHPSIYQRKVVDRRSSGVEDCSHWCLPGVPDTWNELLYFHLLTS